jgi:hypothetical protein
MGAFGQSWVRYQQASPLPWLGPCVTQKPIKLPMVPIWFPAEAENIMT